MKFKLGLGILSAISVDYPILQSCKDWRCIDPSGVPCSIFTSGENNNPSLRTWSSSASWTTQTWCLLQSGNYAEAHSRKLRKGRGNRRTTMLEWSVVCRGRPEDVPGLQLATGLRTEAGSNKGWEGKRLEYLVMSQMMQAGKGRDGSHTEAGGSTCIGEDRKQTLVREPTYKLRQSCKPCQGKCGTGRCYHFPCKRFL